MATGQIVVGANLGGISVQNTITKTFDHTDVYGDGNTNIPLLGGKGPLTSWAKTDADTAAGDIPVGHGYSTGKMDVFWTTGGGGSRYDVDVTVTGDAAALDGGVGDDFPATADATVTVTEVQQVATNIDGDEVVMFVINSTVRASVYFEDTGGALVARFEVQANEPYTWHDTSGVTNPLTGNPITVAYVTSGTTDAGVLTIMVGDDATP